MRKTSSLASIASLSSDWKVQEKNFRVLTALIGTVLMGLNGKGVAKTWRRTESMSGHPFRCVVLLHLFLAILVASSCHMLHVSCPVRLLKKKDLKTYKKKIYAVTSAWVGSDAV